MNAPENLVILNPEAGRGRSWRVWRVVKKELLFGRFDYDFYVTSAPGDAMAAACKAVECGYRMIIAVGGDGTIHEIVNSPLPKSECGLAIIPAGSGNDFARSIHVPENPPDLARMLTAGTWRDVDLAMVNKRYFINIAGIGFDAEVARVANQKRFAVPGPINYLISILQTLPKYTSAESSISVDGKSVCGDLFIAAIGNGRYYGGGIKMCPTADTGDGMLDVVAVWHVRKTEVLRLLVSTYKGMHVNHPKVRCYKGKVFKVETARPLWIQADGEIIGQTPAEITVLPLALRVRIPRK